MADESSSCSSLRVSHLASVRLGKPRSANATPSVACGETTRAKWDCRLSSHTAVTYLTPADTLVTLETNGGTPFGTLPLLRYRSTAESSYLSAVSQCGTQSDSTGFTRNRRSAPFAERQALAAVPLTNDAARPPTDGTRPAANRSDQRNPSIGHRCAASRCGPSEWLVCAGAHVGARDETGGGVREHHVPVDLGARERCRRDPNLRAQRWSRPVRASARAVLCARRGPEGGACARERWFIVRSDFRMRCDLI